MFWLFECKYSVIFNGQTKANQIVFTVHCSFCTWSFHAGTQVFPIPFNSLLFKNVCQKIQECQNSLICLAYVHRRSKFSWMGRNTFQTNNDLFKMISENRYLYLWNNLESVNSMCAQMKTFEASGVNKISEKCLSENRGNFFSIFL